MWSLSSKKFRHNFILGQRSTKSFSYKTISFFSLDRLMQTSFLFILWIQHIYIKFVGVCSSGVPTVLQECQYTNKQIEPISHFLFLPNVSQGTQGKKKIRYCRSKYVFFCVRIYFGIFLNIGKHSGDPNTRHPIIENIQLTNIYATEL